MPDDTHQHVPNSARPPLGEILNRADEAAHRAALQNDIRAIAVNAVNTTMRLLGRTNWAGEDIEACDLISKTLSGRAGVDMAIGADVLADVAPEKDRKSTDPKIAAAMEALATLEE